MADADDFALDDYVVPQKLKESLEAVLAQIMEQAAPLTAFPEAVRIRPGFRHSGETSMPAVVIAVLPPQTTAAVRQASELSRRLNLPVVLEEASPQEQLAFFARGRRVVLASEIRDMLEPPPLEFRPPLKGHYDPPTGLGAPTLEVVEEPMELTIATSPDSGWPVLREFLTVPVQKSMHVGIYQFTAPHVYKALRRVMLDDDEAVLTMTLHPRPEKIPETGTKSEDIFGPTILERLENALGGRFQHAFTTLGEDGEFASAYHIKVIVIDRKRFWLSSGNLQSSNQPPFDPFSDDELPTGFHRTYNREHHVVIKNEKLAKAFAGFLTYDFTRASEATVDFALPDLMVTAEAELLDFAPPEFFRPLKLSGTIRVEPLLTPDNYPGVLLKLIKSAKRRLWIQNQYINLNPQGDFPEFKRIVNQILKQIEKGLDVRIICRDLMGEDKLDLLLALGFPREVFRFMTATHTKVVIVDDDRVMIGSHNLSNEGTVTNRDASLIIHHTDAVEFCARVFEYDWQRRATAKPQKKKPRVARPGERPEEGSFRVSWSAVYDDLPIPTPRPSLPTDPNVNSGPAEMTSFNLPEAETDLPPDDQVFVNGLDFETGEPLIPPLTVAALANRLRGQPEVPPPEVKLAYKDPALLPFGLPDSVDPDNLQEAGWGVIVPEARRDDLLPLIKTLWDHRAKTVPANRLKVLTYKPGESCRAWLKRHGTMFGTQLPTAVPFHLLLLASPIDISFEFQYLLDLEYSVGRLWFDQPERFQSYCDAVVKTETGGSDRSRKIAWFAPRHDDATKLSHDELVKTLMHPDPESFTSLSGYASLPLLASNATRSKLIAELTENKPGFLFTASHGLGLKHGHVQQAALQGALVTADWQGGAPNEEQCLAAQHIEADLRGMVAFLFACFGAGTPAFDDFPKNLAIPKTPLAPHPFVAALPQALLARGTLAVIGHVDRAWGSSIRPATVRQIGPFRNALDRILRGRCVGNATRDFSDRSAVLSQELLDQLGQGGTTADDAELVWNWVERNDARAYVVLGDPAVRLAIP